jgi:hypothetical protein
MYAVKENGEKGPRPSVVTYDGEWKVIFGTCLKLRFSCFSTCSFVALVLVLCNPNPNPNPNPRKIGGMDEGDSNAVMDLSTMESGKTI